jgi:hypothetical protein
LLIKSLNQDLSKWQKSPKAKRRKRNKEIKKAPFNLASEVGAKNKAIKPFLFVIYKTRKGQIYYTSTQ